MIPVSQAFLDAQKIEEPIVLLFLQGRTGRRVYGIQTPTTEQMGTSGGLAVYDGTHTIGDGTIFGSTTIVIDWGDQALSFGSLRETLSPDGADLLTSLSGSEIPNMGFTLDNIKEEFSNITAEESFLNQTAILRIGYPSLSYSDWLSVYTGIVKTQHLSRSEFSLQTKAGQIYELYETFYLGKSSRYVNPKNETDNLPFVFGDNSSTTGVWQAIYIDTVNFRYLIADHAILSLANGNVIKVFDSENNEITSGWSVSTSGIDENGRTIAYIEFTTEQTTEIFVSGSGMATDGSLIENPVDVLSTLLNEILPSVRQNTSAFARARQIVESVSLTAGGLLLQDNSPAAYLQQICASFLADWWTNSEGEIVISFDNSGEITYNIAAFLVNEADYTEEPVIENNAPNLCNQAAVFYARRYTNIDRRTKSGARLGDYDEFDDGNDTKDDLSQNQYGIQQREFQLDWVRDALTASGLQNQIIAQYKDPLDLVTLSENSFKNSTVERGDYVVASVGALRDENKLPLKNQIWKVLDVNKNYDAFVIQYLLQDTGQFWAEPPIVYDGSYTIGSYPGRLRDRRNLT